MGDLPPRMMLTPQHASVVTHQKLFGYTNEELRLILAPMAMSGGEALGSMGHDAAIAALSERPRLIFDYFTQLFAQVTNPPLDAIREELVTSNRSKLGPEGNLLEPTEASCRQIILPYPVIDNDDLAKLAYVNEHGETPGYQAFAIDGLFEPTGGGEALRVAIEDVRRRVGIAIALGSNVIILSDRNSNARLAPIPSLLLTAAVHEHLVREKSRTRVGLVIECGDAREVHHIALLIGYGASAVNPYLAFETLDDVIAHKNLLEGVSPRQARTNYIKAACKGVIKIMSKMGVSTVASYTGAQIFEAVGRRPRGRRRVLHGHGEPHRGGRARRPRPGGGGTPPPRPPGAPHRTGAPRARGRRRVPVATRRGDPPLQSQDGVQAPARHAGQAVRHLQGVHEVGGRPGDGPGDAARVAPVARGCPASGAGGRGRACLGDRQAFRHRCHVVRVDLRRGARDPRHRHEPPRWEVQHRGGWRGRGALCPGRQRRPAPQRHQAGGLGPLRRHERVPGQRGRPPDQDRPGGQARRGWAAAGAQGVPLDRQDQVLDPGGGADLPAPAPRHLLHRGHRPAHPRPEVGEPGCPGARQAGGRGRGGDRRGRSGQGQVRRRAHLGPRRWDRRQSPHLDQARRDPLGARPGRDPADPGPQRPARPHRRAGGRAAQDGS